MKTLVMTVMALMVATAAVAEDKKPPNYKEELNFSCAVTGNNDGFDALVENEKTNEWQCDVTVETTDGNHSASGRPVHGYSGKQNLFGKAGLKKDLKCQVKSVSCTLTKQN